MSIATAITDLSGRIQSAYDACESKGATMPASKTTWNLSSTIESIPAGGGGATMFGASIADLYEVVNGQLCAATDNGQDPLIDLTFSEVSSIRVDINLSSNDRISSVVFPDLKTLNMTGTLDTAFADCKNLKEASFPELSGYSGRYQLQRTFIGCSNLTSFSMPKLIDMSGQFLARNAYFMPSAFVSCTNLQDVDFQSLTAIDGTSAVYKTFVGCTSLQSITFPSVQHIGGSHTFENTFDGCTSLTSINFPQLTSMTGDQVFNSFDKRTAVTNMEFPELVQVTAATSQSNGNIWCQTIQNLYFPKLTTITNNYMFYTKGSIQSLHFAAANQAAIEATTGYSTLWGLGAGAVTVYFDL